MGTLCACLGQTVLRDRSCHLEIEISVTIQSAILPSYLYSILRRYPETMIEHRRNACLNCHHDPGAYSTAQKSVQQVISVVLGPPSMAFGVITLVLVWRIRRNFRHE